MTSEATSRGVPWPGTLAWLRILIVVTLVVLGILYVLGMEVNIYSSPPYSSSDLIFSLHYSLGILSVAFGLAILAVSVLTHKGKVVLTSAVGFFAVLGAGQAGREFAFSGGETIFSLEMSIGFIIAFSAYFSAERLAESAKNRI